MVSDYGHMNMVNERKGGSSQKVLTVFQAIRMCAIF